MRREEKGFDTARNSTASGSLIGSLLKNIATLGFIGYLPVAPGTWGTAAGLIFIGLVPMSAGVLLTLIIAGAIIGTIAAGIAERVIGEADSGHIIIDEFVGFFVAVAFIPRTYGYLAAAFLLFRFFDILKPFPIRNLERTIKGGAGIMADDILAGFLTNVVLQIWKKSF